MIKWAVGLYIGPILFCLASWLFGPDWLTGAAVMTVYGGHLASMLVLGYVLGQRNLLAGGKLIMDATSLNDQYDVRKLQTITNLFKEGVKAGRQDSPMLVGSEWDDNLPELPPLVPFGQQGGN